MKIFKWSFNYIRLFFLKLVYGSRIKFQIKMKEHSPYISWKSKIGISPQGQIIFKSGVYISPYTQVQALDSAKIILEENCYVGDYSRIVAKKYVKIYKNCLLANNVSVYDHDHRFDNLDKKIEEQGYSVGDVVIEKDCWLATNSVILKNTFIPEHSVVGANSVVSGHLKKNGVYAGAPATLKRILNEN